MKNRFSANKKVKPEPKESSQGALAHRFRSKAFGCVYGAVTTLGFFIFAAIFVVNGYVTVNIFKPEFDVSLLLPSVFWLAIFMLYLWCYVSKKHRFKVMLICASVWIIATAVLVTVSYITRERDAYYHLQGQWSAETDTLRSELDFKGDEEEMEGIWELFDLESGDKEVIVFTVMSAEEYLMKIKTSDDDIRYIPFSLSGDTLFFDGIKHSNPKKDIPIPENKLACIRDGIITPLPNDLFMGMPKYNVKKAIEPSVMTDDTYDYTHNGIQVKCLTEYNSDGALNEIELTVEDMTTCEAALAWLTSEYGEGKREPNTYATEKYSFESGNLNVYFSNWSTYYTIRFYLDFSYRVSAK